MTLSLRHVEGFLAKRDIATTLAKERTYSMSTKPETSYAFQDEMRRLQKLKASEH